MVQKSITLADILNAHRLAFKIDNFTGRNNFHIYYLETKVDKKWFRRRYYLPPRFQKDPREHLIQPKGLDNHSRVAIDFKDQLYWIVNYELGINQDDFLHPSVSTEDAFLIKLAAQDD